MHVAIDIIPRRLSARARKRTQRMVRWVVILFCFFGLVIGGSRLVYITFVLEQDSPALHLPLAYVYLSIPMSGLLVIYYKVDELIRP
jgi:TRAP-type C4-dicarboxylate transport system permease small subunit